MCLILLAYRAHPRFRLVLAANRDEFYERPTAPLQEWDEAPGLLAGRDLKAGGTWLGLTRSGRLAAITNYREPGRRQPGARSRGLLVLDYMRGSDPAPRELARIAADGGRYNGFSLIAGDRDGLYAYSNRGGSVKAIEAGVHGLSNHLLDTDWPKVKNGRTTLRALLTARDDLQPESLFGLLRNGTPAPDADLPDTGIGREWERALSPLFIASESYGTRSSSVILWEENGLVTFAERSYPPGPHGPNTSEDQIFRFELASA
jgi:uncharacterized protein with NRDE domain